MSGGKNRFFLFQFDGKWYASNKICEELDIAFLARDKDLSYTVPKQMFDFWAETTF